MSYVAGVLLPGPDASASAWDSATVTVTIAEIDLRARRPTLRVVHHLQWAAGTGDELQRAIRHTLLDDWRCRRVVVGAVRPDPALPFPYGAPGRPPAVALARLDQATRSRMGIALLEAVTAGRVKAYLQDRSPESREFWAQIVKAQSRVDRDGTLELYVDASPGGDGLLLGLALVVEAAGGLFQPSQGRLHDLVPA